MKPCQCLECRINRESDTARAAADAREAEIDQYGYGRPPGYKPGPIVGPIVGPIGHVTGSEPVTLADPVDAYNFHVGQPVHLTWSAAGGVRRATRWEVLRDRVAARLLHWTRWLRPRTVTAAVDVEAGAITLCTERWSWRRWRWERV
ncbi:MAG TPA: hypothetical protein VJU58_06115 [Microbacterium sp.]|nr:hypothetical protein [Microbacterium sp.]